MRGKVQSLLSLSSDASLFERVHRLAVGNHVDIRHSTIDVLVPNGLYYKGSVLERAACLARAYRLELSYPDDGTIRFTKVAHETTKSNDAEPPGLRSYPIPDDGDF